MSGGRGGAPLGPQPEVPTVAALEATLLRRAGTHREPRRGDWSRRAGTGRRTKVARLGGGKAQARLAVVSIAAAATMVVGGTHFMLSSLGSAQANAARVSASTGNSRSSDPASTSTYELENGTTSSDSSSGTNSFSTGSSQHPHADPTSAGIPPGGVLIPVEPTARATAPGLITPSSGDGVTPPRGPALRTPPSQTTAPATTPAAPTTAPASPTPPVTPTPTATTPVPTVSPTPTGTPTETSTPTDNATVPASSTPTENATGTASPVTP